MKVAHVGNLANLGSLISERDIQTPDSQAVRTTSERKIKGGAVVSWPDAVATFYTPTAAEPGVHTVWLQVLDRDGRPVAIGARVDDRLSLGSLEVLGNG